MKPRNKRELEIATLSEYLPPLREQEEWARENLFEHTAFKSGDEAWCSDCAHSFSVEDSDLIVDLDLAGSIECPHCGQKLNLKVSRKQKYEEINYMTVACVFHGYQVLRHVYCLRFTRKKDAYLNFFFKEVVQEWISEDGKRTIMALPMNMGSNGWLYGESLSIKDEYGSSYYHSYGDRYALCGEIYPKIELLPILHKYGLRNSFHDLTPSKLILTLLSGNGDFELCLKTKQYSMLRYLGDNGLSRINYKPSFNICNRNKYKIKDASMWVDYLDLLSYFNKDLHNAKYVCPKNLKMEHDILMKRKQNIEAKRRAERQREEAIRAAILRKEAILEFYKQKEKFFGICISDGEISICPLESVTQFYLEAKAMHHCVFSNEYFKKEDCLIISARIGSERIETIELNLKTLQVVQSRGVCNTNTKYHDRIIGLVKNNIGIIRKKLAL